MSTVDPRRSLALTRAQVDALNQDILALTPEQWQAPSVCGGWQVADLVAHVVRNGWSILAFVQGALAGDPRPTFGPAVAHIQEEIKAAGSHAAAERQQRETDELAGIVAGLDDRQLETVNEGHPSGPRTVGWACNQRLVEVAYHHWDLRRSLGQDGPLDEALASAMLPFLLDPRGSSIMVRPPAEGSPPETFRLRSSGDGASWRISVSPGSRRVEAEASGPAGVDIAAPAGWLALALYGRVGIAAPQFQVSGPADAAARFAGAFGG